MKDIAPTLTAIEDTHGNRTAVYCDLASAWLKQQDAATPDNTWMLIHRGLTREQAFDYIESGKLP